MEPSAYSQAERVLYLRRNILDKLDVLELEGDSESVVEAVWGLCYSGINLCVFADGEIFDAMVRCLHYYGEGMELASSVEKMFWSAIRDVKAVISDRQKRRTRQYDRILSVY